MIAETFFKGRSSRSTFWKQTILMYLLTALLFALPALIFVTQDVLVATTQQQEEQQSTQLTTAGRLSGVTPKAAKIDTESAETQKVLTEQRKQDRNKEMFLHGTITAIFFLIACLSGVLANVLPHIRRLHDLGHSGWFSLLMFIPIVGPFLWLGLFIYCGFFSGQPGENKYGPAPV